MELWAFIGGAFVLAVIGMWRVRRRGTAGKERYVEGLPDDQRDKNTGLASLPNRGRPWGGGN